MLKNIPPGHQSSHIFSIKQLFPEKKKALFTFFCLYFVWINLYRQGGSKVIIRNEQQMTKCKNKYCKRLSKARHDDKSIGKYENKSIFFYWCLNSIISQKVSVSKISLIFLNNVFFLQFVSNINSFIFLQCRKKTRFVF